MTDPDWRLYVYERGPYAVVLGIFVFMIWIRTRIADRIITPNAVFFSTGNDPWYHARIIQLTVDHFPATPMFDPWSYFPYGTGRHSGFGGLFDQLIALAALIAGGGAPSERTVDIVIAYAPPVFGALTIIPVYFIAKRWIGRWSALIPVSLLALTGGQFLSRTVVGTADHQSAEAFFGALAVLGFLYAIETAYTEKPTLDDVRDRNWFALRQPLTAGLLGGSAIAAYLMTWPPGVFLVFTMGLFVVLHAMIDYRAGVSLEYLAFGTVAGLTVTALFLLGYLKTVALEATAFSLLQPLVALGVAAGAVVLYALSVYWQDATYPDQYYPAVVAGLIAGVTAIVALVFPRTLGLLEDLIVRIYSFGLLTSPSALTVAEIQPASLDSAWRAFGPVFYVAIIGAFLLVVRQFRARRPVELLVLLWSLTIASAYFTSLRFGYYMAVNVALLAGFVIWWVGHHLLQLDTSIDEVADLEAFQIIGVIIILVAVVPGNVVAVEGRQPVWTQADGFRAVNQAWYDETTWMRNNTPEEPLDYDKLYEPPADGDFDYPDSAYGVMSWWDYGHWITRQGRRIPNANPFQQGPRVASAFLQAQNETRANLILDALPAVENGSRIANASNAELRSLIESRTDQERGERTRYVIIDDQMAAYSPGKFRPIATWTGPGRDSYISRQEFRLQGVNQSSTLVGVNEQYQSTMLSRLYFNDASGLNHYRLVHESEAETRFVSVARRTSAGTYQPLVINTRLTSGIFNAVQRNPSLVFYDVRPRGGTISRVKTFERVEGATLAGSINTTNQTTVFAQVQLRTNTNRSFTYFARTQTTPDGDFNLTVPYPTEETVGPAEGGTDSAVVATSNYTLFAGNPFFPESQGNTSVPESAIYNGTTITVEMSPPPDQNMTVNTTSDNQSSLGQPPFSPGMDLAEASGPEGRPDGSNQLDRTYATTASRVRVRPPN